MNSPTLSQCIEGYVIAAQARHLSPNTIRDYTHSFRRLQQFLKSDPPLDQIDVSRLTRFMASLDGLAKKTAFNIHTALSALWRWAAIEKIVASNIVREIPAPVPEARSIVPFSQDDVKAMMGVLDKSRPYT